MERVMFRGFLNDSNSDSKRKTSVFPGQHQRQELHTNCIRLWCRTSQTTSPHRADASQEARSTRWSNCFVWVPGDFAGLSEYQVILLDSLSTMVIWQFCLRTGWSGWFLWVPRNLVGLVNYQVICLVCLSSLPGDLAGLSHWFIWVPGNIASLSEYQVICGFCLSTIYDLAGAGWFCLGTRWSSWFVWVPGDLAGFSEYQVILLVCVSIPSGLPDLSGYRVI